MEKNKMSFKFWGIPLFKYCEVCKHDEPNSAAYYEYKNVAWLTDEMSCFDGFNVHWMPKKSTLCVTPSSGLIVWHGRICDVPGFIISLLNTSKDRIQESDIHFIQGRFAKVMSNDLIDELGIKVNGAYQYADELIAISTTKNWSKVNQSLCVKIAKNDLKVLETGKDGQIIMQHEKLADIIPHMKGIIKKQYKLPF